MEHPNLATHVPQREDFRKVCSEPDVLKHLDKMFSAEPDQRWFINAWMNRSYQVATLPDNAFHPMCSSCKGKTGHYLLLAARSATQAFDLRRSTLHSWTEETLSQRSVTRRRAEAPPPSKEEAAGAGQ